MQKPRQLYMYQEITALLKYAQISFLRKGGGDDGPHQRATLIDWRDILLPRALRFFDAT